jgi:beta-lactamase regulating signal transducer with metallopeptidase domain
MQTIGLSLLHSLWQSALLAMLVFLLLRWMRNSSSNQRYLVGVIGMFVMFCLPIVTFFRQNSMYVADIHTYSQIVDYVLLDKTIQTSVSTGSTNDLINQIGSYIGQNAGLFTIFWITGVALMLIRFSGGIWLTYRLKRKGRIVCPEHWQQRLIVICNQLGINRKVRIFESMKITMPMVIGYIKPVILIPAGTLAQMPYDQIEMVLLHELAHIRRADYLVNIFQSLVEILLFFNPFVWWITAVIRHERENCCDDLALGMNQQPGSLAKALVNLSEIKLNQSFTSNLLYFNKINTMKRIERMFHQDHRRPATREKLIVSLLAFVFVVIISTDALLAKVSDRENETKEVNMFTTSEYLIPVSDTLKKSGNIEVIEKRDVSIEMKDGKIVKAIVNGKEVPPEEFLKMEGSQVKSNNIQVTKVITVSGNDRSDITEIDTITSADNIRKIVVVKSIHRNAPSAAPQEVEMSQMTWEEKNNQPEKVYNFKMSVTNPEADSTTVFLYNTEREGDSLVKIVGIDEDPAAFMNVFQQFLDEGYEIEEEVVIIPDQESGDQERFAIDQEIFMKDQERFAIDQEEMHRMEREMRAFPELPAFPEDPYMDSFYPRGSLQDDLWMKELVDEGYAQARSNVILSRKQLIIDNVVMDRKTQRHFLNRFEEINGRKLEAEEAINLRIR